MAITEWEKTQSSARSGWGAGASSSSEARLLRRYPGLTAIMKAARRRIPGFAYDYLEGGVGDEICIRRNRKAFDDIEIIPRYGVDVSAPSTAVRLFGRDYAMPLGISPMGLAGLVWPGADAFMAAAAEKERIPFVLSMVSNIDVETIVRIAPNSTWLQLYAVPQNDNRVTFDMVERAARAGVHALVLTLDTPMRQKRQRDIRNGLTVPFRPTPYTICEVATAWAWALATLRQGQPLFANFLPYVDGPRRPVDVAGYVDRYMQGPFTWEVIARIRRKWQGPLMLKGVQHLDDAVHAADLGVDGIILSNHGGRQFDAAPAAMDVVQSFRENLQGRIVLMLDGSVHSGLDILKAAVCGADAVFAGRPFLAATAALGRRGPFHVAAMFRNELRGVMAQAGLTDIAATASVAYRMNRHEAFSSGKPPRR